MTNSTYPNGFPNGVTIRGVPIQQTHMGKMFYVNGTTVVAPGGQGGSNGNKGTYLAPFATIAYAVTQCVSGRGDVIVVAPNHTESVADATTLVIEKNDVAIVGLGIGGNRPTINLTTATTATITVSADSVSFSNIIIGAAFADVASGFTVVGADFTLENCLMTTTGADLNFVTFITYGAADLDSTGLTIDGCKFFDLDTAVTSLLTSAYTSDAVKIKNSYMNLGVNSSDLPIIIALATGKYITNLELTNNHMIRLNDANALLITTDTATNSGVIADNFVRHADVAAELLVTTGTAVGFFNNYATAVADASGFLLPAADS